MIFHKALAKLYCFSNSHGFIRDHLRMESKCLFNFVKERKRGDGVLLITDEIIPPVFFTSIPDLILC